ncbi:hypothetical protein BS78_09G008800, partial [Paspalum vaginatum]
CGAAAEDGGRREGYGWQWVGFGAGPQARRERRAVPRWRTSESCGGGGGGLPLWRRVGRGGALRRRGSATTSGAGDASPRAGGRTGAPHRLSLAAGGRAHRSPATARPHRGQASAQEPRDGSAAPWAGKGARAPRRLGHAAGKRARGSVARGGGAHERGGRAPVQLGGGGG